MRGSIAPPRSGQEPPAKWRRSSGYYAPGRRGDLRHFGRAECTSEVKVPTLLQPFPICKRLTEGKAAIFGKTEGVDGLVVDELRHTLLPKIVLDVPQVPCREVGADLHHIKLLLF